jgi:hypothetical protein
LWHDEDDTIFGVPQRTLSLARVIPHDAEVMRQPIHGLDTEPARAYVAALDDTGLPLADLKWQSPTRATIQTSMQSGQLISVQETFMPGWRATVSGHAVPVHGDKLGLIVIDPACNGPCQINLEFGVLPEGWVCRVLSALVTLIAITALVRQRLSASRRT